MVDYLRAERATGAFLFRLHQQLRDGGFVAVTGESGTGKSAALRIAAARLQTTATSRSAS